MSCNMLMDTLVSYLEGVSTQVCKQLNTQSLCYLSKTSPQVTSHTLFL